MFVLYKLTPMWKKQKIYSNQPPKDMFLPDGDYKLEEIDEKTGKVLHYDFIIKGDQE